MKKLARSHRTFLVPLACLFSKNQLELFRQGPWFPASLPNKALVCIPGFIPDINSGDPTGLISSDGCIDNDLAI